MTVAIFSDCFFPTKNGVVTVILQLRESLQRLGHKVIVVTVKPDIPVTEEEDVIRVPAVPLGLGTSDQYVAVTTAHLIAKQLKDRKIDIIHVHSEFMMGTVGYRVARKLKIPAVFTTHTLWEEFYKFYLPMGRFIPVKFIRNWLRVFTRKFYAVVNVSYKAYKYFHEDYMAPDRPSVIIPNSIEPSKFCIEKASDKEIAELKAKYGIKNGDKLLIFVGRLGEEKRIFELLDVCKNLVARSENIKVIFVGDGPALVPMQKHSEQEFRRGRIIYSGFVNWFDVHKYYEMSDLFITASLSEMHSMTVLEALLSGLPIVARNDLSLVDTIYDGENGILVESEAEMEETILKLVSDEEKLQRFSEKSFEISKLFSPDVFVRRHLAFYEQVIKAFPKQLNEKAIRNIVENIK